MPLYLSENIQYLIKSEICVKNKTLLTESYMTFLCAMPTLNEVHKLQCNTVLCATNCELNEYTKQWYWYNAYAGWCQVLCVQRQYYLLLRNENGLQGTHYYTHVYLMQLNYKTSFSPSVLSAQKSYAVTRVKAECSLTL